MQQTLEERLPGVVVAGCAGRMGQRLVAAVHQSSEMRLAGALESAGHPWVGRDWGEAMGGAPCGVIVGDDAAQALVRAQAVIDFTTPAASAALAQLAAQARAVHVLGTTGMSAAQEAWLASCGRHTVVVRAGNMSLGVTILTQLTRCVAATLGAEYDIEVIEAHHRRKVDAPSGTALMLGAAAAAGRGVDLSEVAARGRDGITGERPRGAIGFSAIRGGDVVGEHDVMFAAEGERIILRHVATDRGIFVRGALRAVLWGLGRDPGLYDMVDVLGLDGLAVLPRPE
ncbi:MAG: 4-hydroxy-tetrahydrodipicolinate reductase [Rhodobacteraceae bacterium]|nr:4-hydroxy-tetrahydrodipicolinate reductase [Paracoccaceae bacterium]